MRGNRVGYVLAAVMLAAAPSAVAQGNPLDNPQMRQMIQRFWNPVVGSGEAYRSMGDPGSPEKGVELALIGKEMVQGKQGYWLELAFNSPELGGVLYAKDLIVPEEETPRKVIFQLPGEAAMEMPVNPHPGPRKVRDTHMHKVGTETITVPAGTFACEHWKDDDGDYWTSSKLSPVTMVKSVSKGNTDVLIKVMSGAKSHITGAVKPWDPTVFMKHMKGRGGR